MSSKTLPFAACGPSVTPTSQALRAAKHTHTRTPIAGSSKPAQAVEGLRSCYRRSPRHSRSLREPTTELQVLVGARLKGGLSLGHSVPAVPPVKAIPRPPVLAPQQDLARMTHRRSSYAACGANAVFIAFGPDALRRRVIKVELAQSQGRASEP